MVNKERTRRRGKDKVSVVRPPSCDHMLAALGAKTLFYVARSIDKEIVVYEARRKGDVLTDDYVDVHWSREDEPQRREVVSQKAQDTFFGATVEKDGTKYKMSISALPSKLITIHLKKSGAVVAKTVINGQESRVKFIQVDFENTGLIPEVVSLTVHGEHRKVPVSESIELTEAIRGRFDVTSFLPNLNDFASLF